LSQVKIIKFGGTSVKNAEAMEGVSQILKAEKAPAVVVLSATAGTTDLLLQMVSAAASGDLNTALELKNALQNRHFELVHKLKLADDSELLGALREWLAKIEVLLKGVYYLGELTDRVKATISAMGELFSSRILASLLKREGRRVCWLDIREVMITDNNFLNAAPQLKTIRGKCRKLLAPELRDGRFVLTQGFIGATESGVTTVLGRGGSDYTAAILGFALDADSVEIWTDVPGVMTADPRIVPSAYSLRELSFTEAAELSFFGARVLHPSTLLPAMEKNIPVRVKNTLDPSDPGTLITREAAHPGRVKAIAFRRHINVVTVESTRMLMAFGFLEKMFAVFANYRIPVDLISTSEISVSLTVGETERLNDIAAELRKFSAVTIKEKMASISLVGDSIKQEPTFLKTVFNALDRVNLEMITFGASNNNLSFVTPEAVLEGTVLRLHEALFEKKGDFA